MLLFSLSIIKRLVISQLTSEIDRIYCHIAFICCHAGEMMLPLHQRKENKCRIVKNEMNMKTLNVTGLNNSVKVVNALAQLLADFQVHYTNLRNLHWNVKGHGFFILHEKYEELYNDAASKIDEIAERMLQLDATPEHRFSKYLEVAKVKELEVVACGRAGMNYVLDTLKLFIAEERQLLQLAADNNDEVTVAMMSDYLKEQEKLSWMLTAFSYKKEDA